MPSWTYPRHQNTMTPEHHTHTHTHIQEIRQQTHNISGVSTLAGTRDGVSYLCQAHVAVAAARLAVHQALHVLALVGVWRGVERYEETGDG